MKKSLLILSFLPFLAQAQNYFAKADSCLKLKDYACAAANYDLVLRTDTESNGLAYMSAVNWAKSGDTAKTLMAVAIYVRNNGFNNTTFFSDDLLKEPAFNFIHNNPGWQKIIVGIQRNENMVRRKKKAKIDSISVAQKHLESHSMITSVKFNGSAQKVYNAIKTYTSFPKISHRLISISLRITDSLNSAYLVCLPPNYDSKKSYPLLFALHGAVFMNTGMPAYGEPFDTTGWNRFYTRYAAINNVIMVFPHADRDYNWMYPDTGFFMIPAMLLQLKQFLNIDDNKVFVAGHSNGATGSFSYLIKEQSPFAGFYGFNTQPIVRTGGTFLRNIVNRSFFNVSTDQDYYFPPNGNDTLDSIMKSIGADYQDHRYYGFPHWFPQFDESGPAHKLLFEDVARRSRNPFHDTIYWQCDDLKYGRCDWLVINELDTTAPKANWQTNINFDIHRWLVLDNKSVAHERDTLVHAFRFPRKSGAIKAAYANNTFTVETSCIKSFSLLISPEMVNLNKPVTVIVNGKQYLQQSITYDKDFLIKGFKTNADRKALWINHIDVHID